MNASFSRTMFSLGPRLRLPAACPSELSYPSDYDTPTATEIVDAETAADPRDRDLRPALSVE